MKNKKDKFKKDSPFSFSFIPRHDEKESKGGPTEH